MVLSMIDVLETFISNRDLENVLQAYGKDRPHPLNQIASYREDNGFAYYNTLQAIQNIIEVNPGWLKRISYRLVNVDDFAEASSALGEVRAYGYLLGAGVQVEPVVEGEGPTPDFRICKSPSNVIEVEVNSKQYSEAESEALKEFVSSASEQPASGVDFREICVTPFGKPGEGENIAENVISKLASIKASERQFTSSCISILWLDFQDILWGLGIEAESALPVRTGNEEFFSGELWYAFYGVEGLPIFERDSLEERAIETSVSMRHNGRFRVSTKIDACIVSFPEETVVLENPYSNNSLPEWLSRCLAQLRNYNFALSWQTWPFDDLKDRVAAEVKRIHALKGCGLYSW